jgi:hypothetical protein
MAIHPSPAGPVATSADGWLTDSARAHRCHEFLARVGGTDNTAPQS